MKNENDKVNAIPFPNIEDDILNRLCNEVDTQIRIRKSRISMRLKVECDSFILRSIQSTLISVDYFSQLLSQLVNCNLEFKNSTKQ